MTREEAIATLETTEYELSNQVGSKYCQKKYEAVKMAIKALEQEPCEDAVSRQAALGALNCEISGRIESDIDLSKYKREFQEFANMILKAQEKAIQALPPVTPTRKHGEWERETFDLGADLPIRVGYKCSECGSYSDSKFNFCPDCGADMRGSEE